MTSLQKSELKKGSLLAEQGKYCKQLYFLEKGIARGFYYKDGKDITSWFALENTFVTSLYAFISQKVSYESIELLEGAVPKSATNHIRNRYGQGENIAMKKI
jgi:hypothetical protein